MPDKSKDQLLLEYEVTARAKWALRVYTSGSVDEYSDKEMTFENGQIVSHEVEAKWRPLVSLSDKQMHRLLETIRASGFFDLPSRVGSDRVKDGTTTHWTINLDGKQHEVTERVSGDEHSTLKKISTLLDNLTGEALESAG